MVLIKEVYLSYGFISDLHHTAPVIVTSNEIIQYDFSIRKLISSRLNSLPPNLERIDIPQFQFNLSILENELKSRFTKYGLRNCRHLTAFVIARLASNCDSNTKNSVHEMLFLSFYLIKSTKL